MVNISTLVKGDLLLMTCTAVPNELKKEAWIKTDALLFHNIKLKDDTSILRPVFLLKTQDDIWKYNYVYFKDTQRYYFVNDITPCTGGCFELICEVDVLMSFQKSIMNCGAFERRSSNVGTGYITDNKIVFNAAPRTKIFEFEEETEDGHNFNGLSYVLGVANQGAYYSLNSDDKSDVPNGATVLDQLQPYADERNIFFYNLMQGVYGQWIYSWDHRDEAGYADCASFVYKAFKAAFPNMPFGQEDITGWECPSEPTSRDLGHFFYDCVIGAVGIESGEPPVQDFTQVDVGMYEATATNLLYQDVNPCAIVFTSASPTSSEPSRRFGWPATDPAACKRLGIPEDRRSECGYGHVLVYVGHMAWHRSTRTYHIWDPDIHANNPEYVDMGGNWIVHTTGGGKYVLWDPNTEKPTPEAVQAPNYPFVSKMYDNGRISGIFLPIYKSFNDLYGGT